MSQDIYLYNESNGVALTSASQPRTGDYPDVAALTQGHHAVPWELAEDNPVVLRVVQRALTADEDAAWVGRFCARLHVPDGQLVLTAGVAWWQDDDDEYTAVVAVEPGTYDVVVHATRYGINGDWIAQGDTYDEDRQPNVDFIVQLTPASGPPRVGTEQDEGWFHADELRLDATGELPTDNAEALEDAGWGDTPEPEKEEEPTRKPLAFEPPVPIPPVQATARQAYMLAFMMNDEASADLTVGGVQHRLTYDPTARWWVGKMVAHRCTEDDWMLVTRAKSNRHGNMSFRAEGGRIVAMHPPGGRHQETFARVQQAIDAIDGGDIDAYSAIELRLLEDLEDVWPTSDALETARLLASSPW